MNGRGGPPPHYPDLHLQDQPDQQNGPGRDLGWSQMQCCCLLSLLTLPLLSLFTLRTQWQICLHKCLEPSDDMAYGLWSKMLDWMDWLGDTPSTVMTTGAPAMLKIGNNEEDKFKYRCYQEEEKNKKWGSCFKHISFVHPLLFWYILKWCVLLKFGYL